MSHSNYATHHVSFDFHTDKPAHLKPKGRLPGDGLERGVHTGWVVAAGGGTGGRLWVWAGTDPASAVTVPTRGRDLAASPAGDRVAVTGADGTAYVYVLGWSPAG